MHVEEQLRKDIDTCECFPLQSDEMVDVAQLCVFSSGWDLKTWVPRKSYSPFCHYKDTPGVRLRSFLMLLWWDLLSRQNWNSSFGGGDIAAKVKSLFDLESSALRTRFRFCKMALWSKPNQYPLILESIQCSGNYWWRRRIPISEDVQLICANLLSHTWKSKSPGTYQQWLVTTL